jgi:hypothetical protein
MKAQSEVRTCDHCENELQADERLERLRGFDDRVCPACFLISALAPKGEDARCVSCREESGPKEVA